VELAPIDRGVLGVSSDVVYARVGGEEWFGLETRFGVFRWWSTVVEVGRWRLDLVQWFEPGIPAVYGALYRGSPMIEEVVKVLGPRLRGRTVVISFSGGKDSVAAAHVVSKICERWGLRAYAVYIHMPYLEPPAFIDEARRVASRLGLDLVVSEPPRRLVRRYLIEEGLPFRRSRWCTYLKTRRLREVARALGARYIVVGDRMWENVKRFRRLRPLVERMTLVKKGIVYPVAWATLLDTVSLARSLGCVHTAYLRGWSRVSCTLCPYKSLHELVNELDRLEDPGLIEHVLRLEWRRWYRDQGIELRDFVEEALWRLAPRPARAMLAAKEVVSERGERVMSLADAGSALTSLWRGFVEPIPIDPRGASTELWRRLALPAPKDLGKPID